MWHKLPRRSPSGGLLRATVYAIGLVFIAAVYIGFSVADARWKVIATETTVAAVFVVVAAAAITGSAWLLVVGFTAIALAAGASFR